MMELTLTDVDNLLLEALRDNGGWMSRSDLRDAIGKLSAYHASRLDYLVAQGLVEADYRIRGVVQKVILYRAVK